MSNGSGFVSSSSFTLPSEILRQLKASQFITGTSTGAETTKALVEGALNPLADLASKREAQGKQFALEREGLDLQRQNIASLAAFREGELALGERRFDEIRKQRKQELFAGVGKLAGLALFLPVGKSTSTTTTLASGAVQTVTNTPSIALKAWNLIFP